MKAYRLAAEAKTAKDRVDEAGEKTGLFTGLYAINPITGAKLPLFTADYVLKDIPGVTNAFIYGEYEDRVKRAVEKYGVNKKAADRIVSSYDKARENYYNYHTSRKWGEYRNYNLSIDSSYISEEEAANLIADYVERRTYR